jgi:hypothetical protein
MCARSGPRRPRPGPSAGSLGGCRVSDVGAPADTPARELIVFCRREQSGTACHAGAVVTVGSDQKGRKLRKIDDAGAAAVLAGRALVEIRFAAGRRPSWDPMTTENLARIRFLADMCHNLPSVAATRHAARPRSSRRPMSWTWNTSGPEAQALMLEWITDAGGEAAATPRGAPAQGTGHGCDLLNSRRGGTAPRRRGRRRPVALRPPQPRCDPLPGARPGTAQLAESERQDSHLLVALPSRADDVRRRADQLPCRRHAGDFRRIA